jgi:hypothetical protein
MIQTAIAAILIFVLVFGIGFILNMLIKTTWLPLYGYLLLLAGTVVWFWRRDGLAFADTLAGFGIPDYAAMIGGLLGAWLSGHTIRLLRAKGYKMF